MTFLIIMFSWRFVVVHNGASSLVQYGATVGCVKFAACWYATKNIPTTVLQTVAKTPFVKLKM